MSILCSHLPQYQKKKNLWYHFYDFSKEENIESLIMLVKRKTDVKFAITPSAFVLETLTQQRLTVIWNLMSR